MVEVIAILIGTQTVRYMATVETVKESRLVAAATISADGHLVIKKFFITSHS